MDFLIKNFDKEYRFHSPDELDKLLKYIKEAAVSLDEYTRELTAFLHNLKPEDNKT